MGPGNIVRGRDLSLNRRPAFVNAVSSKKLHKGATGCAIRTDRIPMHQQRPVGPGALGASTHSDLWAKGESFSRQDAITLTLR
jgi:hypothetical protein